MADVRNLALLTVFTLLSLVGAELVVRLFLPPTYTRVNVTTFGELGGPPPPSWSGVPYRLVPGATQLRAFRSDPRGYFDPGPTLTYRINQLGFRGRETTLEKPDGLLRIVGLGDSFTFGVGVRAHDTFLAVLETALREDGGAPVEVLNLGVMGFDTSHEVSLLRHLGLRLSPDLVVLCLFLNDAGATSTHQLLNPGRDSRNAVWRRSRLLDRAVHALTRPQGVKTMIAEYRKSFTAESPGWLSVQRALTRANRLAEAHGFDFVVMIFPVLWQLTDDYPFRGIHETVRAAAEAEGIPVLDLLPAFNGYDGPELWVTPTNQHPNELAHAIAGKALYDFLVARGLPTPGR